MVSGELVLGNGWFNCTGSVGREETRLLEFLQDTFSVSMDLAEALAYAVTFRAPPKGMISLSYSTYVH